jgi:hypothetical protein
MISPGEGPYSYLQHSHSDTYGLLPKLMLTPSLPPVLCDPLVAKAHYEKIEKEVEEGVRQSQTREKAFPPKSKAKAET